MLTIPNFTFPNYVLLAYRPTELTPEAFLKEVPKQSTINNPAKRIVSFIDSDTHQTVLAELKRFKGLKTEDMDNETGNLIVAARVALRELLKERVIKANKQNFSMYEFVDLMGRTGMSECSRLKLGANEFILWLNNRNDFLELYYGSKPKKYTTEQDLLIKNPSFLETVIKEFLKENDAQELADFIWLIGTNEFSLLKSTHLRKIDKLYKGLQEAVDNAVDHWLDNNSRLLLIKLKRAGLIEPHVLAHQVQRSNIKEFLVAWINQNYLRALPGNFGKDIGHKELEIFLSSVKDDLKNNPSDPNKFKKLVSDCKLTDKETKETMKRLYELFAGDLIEAWGEFNKRGKES